MAPQAHALKGRDIAAFAGIGRPEKFFAALEAIGLRLVQRTGFADHHRYTVAELDRLVARARAAHAVLVTTPKDAVRLPASLRVQVTVLDVALCWRHVEEIEGLLQQVVGRLSSDQV